MFFSLRGRDIRKASPKVPKEVLLIISHLLSRIVLTMINSFICFKNTIISVGLALECRGVNMSSK